jgi:hypothetical protein
VENKIDINKIDEQLDAKDENISSVDVSNYAETIEQARTDLFNAYSKSRLKSNIMMGVIVVAVIGCFILASQNNIVLQILGYCIGGAALIAMIVHHLVTRNKLPNKTKEYIALVTTNLNGRAFVAGDYKEVKTNIDERLELADVSSDSLYTGINQIASRNVIHGKYHDSTFLVSDLALYTYVGKNRTTNFVGKYITLPNNLSFEGRFVFVIKNKENEIDPSNNLDDLTLLNFETDHLLIYGPQDTKYNFNKQFIDKLESLKLSDNLLNVNIIIWAGHSAAYLSYNDSIIALPFEKEFNKEAFEEYVSNQNTILEGFKTLL